MKPRHSIYLDKALSQRLNALTAKPGTTKSTIVADALKAHLDRRAANELDELFKARLNLLGAQTNRIERNLIFLMESLALFIRYQFALTPPQLDGDAAAARALAQDRFEAFVVQVGRRVAAGKTFAATLDQQSGTEAQP
jgi:hypothetical protein